MDEKTMAILQMVQDGKISAQEAATLINSLRDAEAVKAAAPTCAEQIPDKIYSDFKPYIPLIALAIWWRLMFRR